MTATEQPRYEPRASNRSLLLRGAYEADQDHPTHRRLSGAADLSLRAMPQRRNDRGEVKTKEMTNDDAERTGKGWFHSQRRRNDTDGNCNRRNSASCLALRVLMRGRRRANRRRDGSSMGKAAQPHTLDHQWDQPAKGANPMWLTFWTVTIVMALGFSVMAQVIQNDSFARGR